MTSEIVPISQNMLPLAGKVANRSAAGNIFLIPGMQNQVARVMDEVITPIPIDPRRLASEKKDTVSVESKQVRKGTE